MSEIINPVISLDFTGVTPAGGLGIGYLKEGIHTATIAQFTQYEDNKGRMYMFMLTDGVRHRDSLNLTPEGMKWIKKAWMSAGLPEDKLNTAIPKFKTEMMVGKTVYFKYVPPQFDDTGRRAQGSYPKYIYYTKAEYDQVQSWNNNETPAEDFAVEEVSEAAPPSNGTNGAPVPVAKVEDDFDYLLKGEV